MIRSTVYRFVIWFPSCRIILGSTWDGFREWEG